MFTQEVLFWVGVGRIRIGAGAFVRFLAGYSSAAMNALPCRIGPRLYRDRTRFPKF